MSLGQLIASITPSIQITALFTAPVSIILSNICGVTVPYPTLSKFWRDWLYQLDPYTRMVGAMLATELQYVQRLVLSCLCAKRFFGSGLKITCKPEEFATFNPPSGQTCAAWASDFVNAAGGYLDNPDDSTACRYCQYSVSDIDKWTRGFYSPQTRSETSISCHSTSGIRIVGGMWAFISASLVRSSAFFRDSGPDPRPVQLSISPQLSVSWFSFQLFHNADQLFSRFTLSSFRPPIDYGLIDASCSCLTPNATNVTLLSYVLR